MTTYSACTNLLLRWAVLKHVTANDTHWDLLLEPAAGEKLLTWRIALPPTDWLGGTQMLPATRIADHRPIYLTYEGEISGNRGRVTREASGTWKPAEISKVKVSGAITGGVGISLIQQRDDQWTLSIQKI